MTKTIMMVDDSASTRQFASIVLSEAGYELIEACDGDDALSKLNGRKVHLIISDVNMPNMDGISFVNAVRTLPEHKFAPVVMITTDYLKSGCESLARKAGVKAWMVKPFNRHQLLEMVARFALP